MACSVASKGRVDVTAIPNPARARAGLEAAVGLPRKPGKCQSVPAIFCKPNAR